MLLLRDRGRTWFVIPLLDAFGILIVAKISLDTEEEVRISTDSSQPLEKAVIARSTRTRGALDNVIGRIVGTLDIGGPMIYLHSQCKYCLLAQGAAHLYVRILDPPDTKEMIWVRTARS